MESKVSFFIVWKLVVGRVVGGEVVLFEKKIKRQIDM